MACRHHPVILREVEVHHLHPLADRGPACTKLDDLAVLCRMFHARAHKNGNGVIPLDQLKEVADASFHHEKKRLISF